MDVEEHPFSELLSNIVDNRGRTCPTAKHGIPLIATNCIRNDLLYPAFDKVRSRISILALARSQDYTPAAPNTTSFRAEPCTSPPPVGARARPSAHRR